MGRAAGSLPPQSVIKIPNEIGFDVAALEQVNQAYRDMNDGKNIRGVIIRNIVTKYAFL
jgi:Zn-dependent alcohol dehydrogenase